MSLRSKLFLLFSGKKTEEQNTIESDNMPTDIFIEGSMFTRMRKISGGWVVEELKVLDGDVVLQKVCNPTLKGEAYTHLMRTCKKFLRG